MKNNTIEMGRIPLMGSLINPTQPRKESVTLKIGRQKILKLKCQGDKMLRRDGK